MLIILIHTMKDTNTEFIKESQQHLYINHKLDTFLIHEDEIKEGNKEESSKINKNRILYFWNNFLYLHDLIRNRPISKTKLTSNPIIKVRKDEKYLYSLSKSTSLEKGQFVKFNLFNWEIEKVIQLNEAFESFDIDFFYKKIYFLSLLNEKIYVYSLENMCLIDEIRLNNKSLLGISSVKDLSFEIFHFQSSSNTSFFAMIHQKSFLFLVNLSNLDFVKFYIKNVNFFKSFSFLYDSSSFISNSNLLRLAASDDLGKIFLFENFLILDDVSNTFLINKDYLVSSHHWHSNACIVKSFGNTTLFSGSNEGVVVLWNFSSSTKTFFPRICTSDIKHLSVDEDLLLIITNDELIVYNYLENRRILYKFFIDSSKLDQLEYISVEKSKVNINNEKKLNRRRLISQNQEVNFNSQFSNIYALLNKDSGVLYIVQSGKSIKKMNFSNRKHNTYNQSRSQTVEKFSYEEISHMNIYYNPLSHDLYIITIEEMKIDKSKIHNMKVYLIENILSNDINLRLVSYIQSPHGEDRIDSVSFKVMSNDSFALVTKSLHEGSKSLVRVWRNKGNHGLVNDHDFEFNTSQVRVSIIEEENEDMGCVVKPYLIIMVNSQILKISLDEGYKIIERIELDSSNPMRNYGKSEVFMKTNDENQVIIIKFINNIYAISSANLEVLSVVDVDENQTVEDICFGRHSYILLIKCQNQEGGYFIIENDIEKKASLENIVFFKVLNSYKIRFIDDNRLIIFRKKSYNCDCISFIRFNEKRSELLSKKTKRIREDNEKHEKTNQSDEDLIEYNNDYYLQKGISLQKDNVCFNKKEKISVLDDVLDVLRK